MTFKNFFCVRGYMKSGTNWVSRLLKNHPDVDCVGEFHWETFFQALEQNVNRIAVKRQALLRNVVRPELESMVRRCLTSLSDENALWVGDRTPTTLAPVVLPKAPHFLVIRDFRDVMVSRMFHLYNNPRVTKVFENFPELDIRLKHFQENPWYFRDNPHELLDNEQIVRDSASEWKTFLQSDRTTQQKYPELHVITVRYEDLHADFDNQVAVLFEPLGVHPPNSFPDSLKPGHASETPNHQNRKGQFGDWKNYMTNELKLWINQEAGEELLRLGYINSLDW